MLFTRILVGLLIIGAGTMILKFNYQLVGLVGRQDWIETKLGMGSTYTAYKLLGIVVVLGGILYLTGYDDNVLNALVAPLRSLFPVPR